jgi:hypothetical protein
MMRHDPQELDDIRFILRREGITRRDVTQAAAKARLPDVSEIQTVFREMIPLVQTMAAEINPAPNAGIE